MKLSASQLLRDGLPQYGFFADSLENADGRADRTCDA